MDFNLIATIKSLMAKVLKNGSVEINASTAKADKNNHSFITDYVSRNYQPQLSMSIALLCNEWETLAYDKLLEYAKRKTSVKYGFGHPYYYKNGYVCSCTGMVGISNIIGLSISVDRFMSGSSFTYFDGVEIKEKTFASLKTEMETYGTGGFNFNLDY